MDYWSPLHRELPPGLIQAKLKETKEKILAKYKITILGRYIYHQGDFCAIFGHFLPQMLAKNLKFTLFGIKSPTWRKK